MRFSTVRWLIPLVLAAASARGQTIPLLSSEAVTTGETCSHHTRVDAAAPDAPPSSFCETSAPPNLNRPFDPGLSRLLSLGRPYLRSTAPESTTAPATSGSCASSCSPVLPFHQPPIDADGILSRCNTGLAGAAVGILHTFFQNR
jgi:hypothetical protein